MLWQWTKFLPCIRMKFCYLGKLWATYFTNPLIFVRRYSTCSITNNYLYYFHALKKNECQYSSATGKFTPKRKWWCSPFRPIIPPKIMSKDNNPPPYLTLLRFLILFLYPCFSPPSITHSPTSLPPLMGDTTPQAVRIPDATRNIFPSPPILNRGRERGREGK